MHGGRWILLEIRRGVFMHIRGLHDLSFGPPPFVAVMVIWGRIEVFRHFQFVGKNYILSVNPNHSVAVRGVTMLERANKARLIDRFVEFQFSAYNADEGLRDSFFLPNPTPWNKPLSASR